MPVMVHEYFYFDSLRSVVNLSISVNILASIYGKKVLKRQKKYGGKDKKGK